mmetsp:Transcript_55695/g.180802  ORF Transcript_55695/g.180802 Transcript_55695/m.180802 type:complete len:359 (+) Transcript_55695:53-1129(+)
MQLSSEVQEASSTVLLGRHVSPTKGFSRKEVAFSLPKGAVKIKNTFISVEGCDDADDDQPMLVLNRAMSAPLGHLRGQEGADSTPKTASTPMVHISELKFMEPAKLLLSSFVGAQEDVCLPSDLPVGSPESFADIERRYSSSSMASQSSPSIASLASTSDSLPRAATSSSSSFKVKNTFIDDFADDASEEGTPGRSVKSCPVRARRSGSGSLSGLASISEARERADPFKIEAAEGLTVPAPPPAPPTSTQALPLPLPPQSTLVQLAEQDFQCAILPLESRQPQWSGGASLHATGECKPCMWFWRPSGCQNAKNCQHCHLCLEGAVQDRRKHRRQATRATGSAPAHIASKCSLRLSALV